MTPQKQLYRHDPDNGVWGDCHRTAIAMVFDLPAEDVPHFVHGWPSAAEVNEAQERWLRARGMTAVNILFDVKDHTEVLDHMHAMQGGDFCYLLSGISRNGTGHVVACRGRMMFDPALDDSGIVGPHDDGFYWVTIFAHLSTRSNLKEPLSKGPPRDSLTA